MKEKWRHEKVEMDDREIGVVLTEGSQVGGRFDSVAAQVAATSTSRGRGVMDACSVHGFIPSHQLTVELAAVKSQASDNYTTCPCQRLMVSISKVGVAAGLRAHIWP